MLSKLHAEKYLTCQPTLSMKLKLIMWKQTQADSSESRASHCNYSSIAAVCPNSQSWGKTDCATVASSPVDNIIPPSPIPPMAVACLRKVHIIWDFWDFGENECKLLLLKKKNSNIFFCCFKVDQLFQKLFTYPEHESVWACAASAFT